MSHDNQAFYIAAQAHVPPLAIGAPGIAKTAVVHAFAEALGRKCYTLIGSIRDSADIGGYPYPYKNGDGTQHMRLMPPKFVADCAGGAARGEKWIIFFDELTTCQPSVQAAMLRILSEKIVGDEPLPQDTILCAAANPPGIAAGGFELEPPMANRLCHVKWSTPWKAWEEGMLSGMDFPPPRIPVLPEGWERGFSDFASLIVAFRKHRPTLFEPEVNEKTGDMKMSQQERGGAWGSMRSWTNGARCMTAGKSVGCSDDVHLDLLCGCVGEGRALEYFEWQRNLDLPDPEQLLHEFMTKKRPEYRHPNRPDKTIALMSSLSAAVRREPTLPRWQAALEIVYAASQEEMDVALSGAIPILTMIRDNQEFKKAGLPDKFKKLVLPSIIKSKGAG